MNLSAMTSSEDTVSDQNGRSLSRSATASSSTYERLRERLAAKKKLSSGGLTAEDAANVTERESQPSVLQTDIVTATTTERVPLDSTLGRMNIDSGVDPKIQ